MINVNVVQIMIVVTIPMIHRFHVPMVVVIIVMGVKEIEVSGWKY